MLSAMWQLFGPWACPEESFRQCGCSVEGHRGRGGGEGGERRGGDEPQLKGPVRFRFGREGQNSSHGQHGRHYVLVFLWGTSPKQPFLVALWIAEDSDFPSVSVYLPIPLIVTPSLVHTLPPTSQLLSLPCIPCLDPSWLSFLLLLGTPSMPHLLIPSLFLD